MIRLRVISVLLALLVLFSLCSCDAKSPKEKEIEEASAEMLGKYSDMPLSGEDIGIGSHDDEFGYHIVNRYAFTHPAGYESDHTAHSYQALEHDSQRELYDRLLDAFYCFSDDDGLYDGEYSMRPLILAGTDHDRRDIEAAIVAVIDDHPEIFWMSTNFDLSFDRGTYTTTLMLDSVYKANEVKTKMKEINDALDAFYDELPSGMSEYEREVYVYKYIIDRCEYDYDIGSTEDYEYEHPSLFNLYGVLVDKLAVCEGYSYTFDYLCSELGVDTVCVSGVTKQSDDDEEGLHLWNAVCLDDLWYMVDCTWDDWDDDSADDAYTYLNVTDADLSLDHKTDKTYAQLSDDEYRELESFVNNFIPPACTATDYCYYLRESIHLTQPDVDALCKGICAAVEKGRDSFMVYVDTDAYTLDEMSEALFDGDQPYYQALDMANAELEDVTVDAYSDAVYYFEDERNIIIFELDYH